MSDSPSPRWSTALGWIVAALPVTSWAAVSLYVSGFDGWGGWAAAPLFLIPVGLSLGVALSEILRIVRLPTGGPEHRTAWARALLASPPALWFLWRWMTAG